MENWRQLTWRMRGRGQYEKNQCCGAATFLGGSGSGCPRSRSLLRLWTKKKRLRLQAKKGGSRRVWLLTLKFFISGLTNFNLIKIIFGSYGLYKLNWARLVFFAFLKDPAGAGAAIKELPRLSAPTYQKIGSGSATLEKRAWGKEHEHVHCNVQYTHKMFTTVLFSVYALTHVNCFGLGGYRPEIAQIRNFCSESGNFLLILNHGSWNTFPTRLLKMCSNTR